MRLMRPRAAALLLIFRLGIIMLLLMVVGGCARPDWIESMLVTVDVTGTWSGRVGTSGSVSARYPAVGSLPAEMTLQQEGPNVTGLVKTLRISGSSVPYDSPISGTVNGDVVRLSAGSVKFELVVEGDRMSGSWILGDHQGPVDLYRSTSRD
jgi:hypothetical protein